MPGSILQPVEKVFSERTSVLVRLALNVPAQGDLVKELISGESALAQHRRKSGRARRPSNLSGKRIGRSLGQLLLAWSSGVTTGTADRSISGNPHWFS
jgi:hypothetical protein